MRFRGRAAFLVVALASGPRARAADCPTIADLRDALAAAADAVAGSRAALASGANLLATLASADATIAAADQQLGVSSAYSPAELVTSRKRIETKILAAGKSVTRAEKHPTRKGVVKRRLAVAAKAIAKARSLFERAAAAASCDVVLDGALGATEVFPADNWWNLDVSAHATLANSDAVVDFIGRGTSLHPDFGTTFGIPYVVLDAPQPLTPLTFTYDDESDHAAPFEPPGYPIPDAAKTTPGYIEGEVAGGGPSGDRHMLLVDRTTHFLFEIYAAQWTGTKWNAGSGAIFDLTSNARRPDGWTSADAAGLAIFPGLVRADEVFVAGEIRHALRFTVRATQGYVYPASHDATHGAGGALRPPLGLRVRLKAGVDLSQMSAPARVVLTAMKKYGLILADNGSDWYVSGAPDPRWDDERMHDDFARITGDDFEAMK